MAVSRISSLLLLLSFVVYFAVSNGFKTKLYHRDFPGSPLYDPTLSLTERVSRAVDRSMAYYMRSASITSITPIAEVKHGLIDYMMKIGLGTPIVEYFVSIDVTSDLTWMECVPCKDCLALNASLFDPSKSSSYGKVMCEDQQQDPCPGTVGNEACVNGVCTYTYDYTDRATTSGDVSFDVITLNSTTSSPIQKIYSFGCGYNNLGFLSPGASGMLGLGLRKQSSFMNQLSEIVEGKFSYCLGSLLSGGQGQGTIAFGPNFTLTQPGVVTTPLCLHDDCGTEGYYAQLEAITIADERISFGVPDKPFSNSIKIEPGLSVSKFPTPFYTKFWETLAKHVNRPYLKDPTGRLPLCYFDEFGLEIPPVTATFVGGAEIYLNRDNLFVQNDDGLLCLAVTGEDSFGNYSVWGNTFQINFWLGFDNFAGRSGTLSFLPVMDCATAD